jgi:hypothetical protein
MRRLRTYGSSEGGTLGRLDARDKIRKLGAGRQNLRRTQPAARPVPRHLIPVLAQQRPEM